MKTTYSAYWLLSLIALSLLFTTSQAQQSQNAQQLYEGLRNSVFQVRVIDIASGDKFTIGSGFLVSDSGVVATNFHVVSSFVHEPEKYRLELVPDNGESIDAELIDFDVIHDLALVRSQGITASAMNLNESELKKGDRIYSMGNPNDLGMTIIEGTYNGLLQHVRHGQILFSGSLNPGMSGGPALNDQGTVIGINVAKSGDDISFLIPVSKLKTLLRDAVKIELDDSKEKIRLALLDDQQQFFDSILDTELTIEPLGEFDIPTNLSPNLRCWGHTTDDKDDFYIGTHQHCRSNDSIYVSNKLYTGRITYDYEWITTEQLNPFQFYQAVSNRFKHGRLYSSSDEDEISEFSCHLDTVDIKNLRWKVSTCFRQYKKYDGLFDSSMTMVTIDHNQKAMLVKYSATGISSENAIRLYKRIMEAIEWKP